MSDKQIDLTIEGVPVRVPAGTLLVDAAKQSGVYVPVFCYHPKLDPVGMCRMCLVEIGRPKRDRESGEFLRDDSGEVLLEFGPKLETACTTPVGDGWVVRTASEKALQGQGEIVEFLLTSHPLDCPVCDKGGECPLQELTMDFGAGKSRFNYGDKMHLGKHVPLGDLIYLDQERCIQCARCTRFQEDIAGDPVIGFEERGRKLQIVTYSDPGFDSYFSGNTTDICPVGALTTADFRFEARPWELKAAASLCSHCPVGCNTMVNTRRQPTAEGQVLAQRIMPRQNEAVNEIWLCDKGRFAHHYAGPGGRLTTPLVRKDEELVEVSWREAIAQVVEGIKQAQGGVVGLASGRLSNEDLFTFRQTLAALDGQAILEEAMAGGDLADQFGLSTGSNLGDLGAGDAVLVVASELHEEAPIWWLRVKQAAQRGAILVVANGRRTRLDKFASHSLTYQYPEAAPIVLALAAAAGNSQDLDGFEGGRQMAAAARALASAKNLVVFYGREGQSYAASQALAAACARLLEKTGHTGRPNNGLVPVWPRANTQGAWDMGFRPAAGGLRQALEGAGVVWLAGVDPAGDDPAFDAVLEGAGLVIVHELAMTRTAELADVVLPAASYLEREGTYTSGERRVQRFYPALPGAGDCLPDWQIVARIAEGLEQGPAPAGPSLVFDTISQQVEAYAGLGYPELAAVESQWPGVGGEDLYFGGTAYANRQGLGIQLGLTPAERSSPPVDLPVAVKPGEDELILVPVDRLYDHGRTVATSDVLAPRLTARQVLLHPDDAERLGITPGSQVELRLGEHSAHMTAALAPEVPAGVALLGRSLGVPLNGAVPVQVTLSKVGG